MARDDFDDKTKEILRRRVNGICSNPNCNHPTQCASLTNSNEIEYIGVAAHICAASKGGPRYDETQSSKDRSSIDNGIHLCSNCATMIDKNHGIDYPATLLRSWKKQAEKRARDAYQNQIRSNGWVVIEFDNQETSYHAPLIGVGLNQKHIKVCPRFESTISEVKKYLNLNYSCCLYGKSGSGKSITAYQIAYDYYNAGYQILKLKSDFNKDEIEIPYEDNLLLIIDNAHNYSENLIEDICCKTKSNLLALFVSSSELYIINTSENDIPQIEQIINPIKIKSLYNIEIDLLDAVKSIKNFCLKNKVQLLPIVQSLNSIVGEDYLSQSIERRIEIAAKEKTPWLFNYILIGGWKNARKEIDVVKNNNRADLLILLIAINQIVTLDRGVTIKTIAEQTKKYNDSADWFKQSFKIIKEKGLLIFDGQYVKLKHIEHARNSLNVLNDENDQNIINIIAIVIKECMSDLNNKKGTYSLLKAISYNWHTFFYYNSISNDNYIINLSEKLLNEENYNEYNIYILEGLIRDGSKIDRKFLDKNKEIINKWVLEVNEHTAYALYNLLNTCINNGLHETKDFLKLDSEYIITIANIFSNKEIGPELYYFSEFFGRLKIFISRELKKIYSQNFKIKQYKITNYEDLIYYSSFCKNIFIEQNSFFESFIINKEAIIKLFNYDCIKFYNNAHEILYYAFYFGPLEIRTNKKQKRLAQELLKEINANEIAKRMNMISKREIRRIGEILHFIAYCHKKNLKKLLNYWILIT